MLGCQVDVTPILFKEGRRGRQEAAAVVLGVPTCCEVLSLVFK